MPPKSAKKDLQSAWHVCDKCEAKVHLNKLKSHEENCGKVLLGVKNENINTLITSSLPPEFNTKGSPVTYLQRFIFIPEAICTFCSFTMGCNLLIHKNRQKYVRSSWTINDKYMDEVFSNSEGN